MVEFNTFLTGIEKYSEVAEHDSLNLTIVNGGDISKYLAEGPLHPTDNLKLSLDAIAHCPSSKYTGLGSKRLGKTCV